METFIWITTFILSNFRGTVIWTFLKQGFRLTTLPWMEVIVWIVLFVMAVRSLIKDSLIADYLRLWRRNWILVIFLAVAFLSLFWSISFSDSLYRGAALLFSSMVGAYIGTRYSLEGLLSILFRFGALLLITCFALALFLPVVGAMDWEPYNGAWRGIFWHKNQLGSIAALFSTVFLIGALDGTGRKEANALTYAVLYLFSIIVIYFSKSVAGYFLLMIMSSLVILVLVWLKTRYRLRAIHYYGILGVGILVLAVIFLNLDLIFGIFSRDTSLTGRIPLWDYLMRDVFAERPWFGYGFGAIWSSVAFRIDTQQRLGWGFPVAIADNGFLDILLHVGLVGFIPFLSVLIISFVRSGKIVLQDHSIVSFFPLLLLIFAVLANISFSLFLETETFLWLVVVAALFIVTRPQQPNRASV